VAGLLASDVAVVFLVRALVRLVRDRGVLGPEAVEFFQWLWPRGILWGPRLLVALVLSLGIMGAYGAGDRRRDPGRVLGAAALACGLIFYSVAWQGDAGLVLLRWVTLVVAFGAVLTLSRMLVDHIVTRVAPRVVPIRAVLVTDGSEDWLGVSQLKESAELGLSRLVPVAVVTTDGSSNGHSPLRDMARLILERKADTVLVTGPLGDRDFAFVVDTALASGCRLLTASRTTRLVGVEPRAVRISGRSMVELTRASLQAWQVTLKRLVDLGGATMGLLLLSPFFVTIAALVKLSSRGPVIFGHPRLGARGRLFNCYKFRSMLPDADAILRSDVHLYRMYVENDYKLPAERDPRLTPTGRLLRKYSLDELPQLFNVLLGQMSLVGPRPIVPEEIDHYGHTAPLFLSLRPGMTGNWAVSGRSEVGYPDRVNMELEYVRQWSLLGDVAILLRTVPAVIRRRGAH